MRNRKHQMLALLAVIFAYVLLFSNVKQNVSYTHEFKVPASNLWGIVSDFSSAKVFGKTDLKFEFEGKGVGAKRTMIFPNGFRIIEVLKEIDDAKMVLKYSIINSMQLPYKDYMATVSIVTKDENTCILLETVDYKTKIWKRKSAKQSLLYFMEMGFENLEKTLG